MAFFASRSTNFCSLSTIINCHAISQRFPFRPDEWNNNKNISSQPPPVQKFWILSSCKLAPGPHAGKSDDWFVTEIWSRVTSFSRLRLVSFSELLAFVSQFMMTQAAGKRKTEIPCLWVSSTISRPCSLTRRMSSGLSPRKIPDRKTLSLDVPFLELKAQPRHTLRANSAKRS